MNFVAKQAVGKPHGALDLGQFYEAIFASEFAVYVLRFDDAGIARFEDANAAVVGIANRPLEAMVGSRPCECLPPEIGDCLETQALRCFTSGEAQNYERTFSTPNGRMAFKTSLTPIPGPDGKIEHIVGMTRDMTNEANLVEDSQQNAALLKRLGIALPNAVYLLNLRDKAIRFLGGDPDERRSEWRREVEAAGSDATLRYIHPDDHAKAAENLQHLATLRDDEVSKVEFRILARNGEYRPHMHRETVFSRTAAGEVELILGVSEDITERDRVEKQVLDLSERLLTSQIDERRRIAEDLHDSTGQHLFAVGLALTRARASQLPGSRSQGSRSVLFEALEDAKHSLQIAQREVRMLSYLLHPPEIVSEGLSEAIRNFARGFGKRSGHYVEVQIAPEVDGLGDDISLNLFRACQEALTNVYRHAEASQAVVVLEIEDGLVQLEVTDDGVGFDSAQALGVGLSGMRERIRRLGGEVEVSGDAGGTCLRVAVPVAAI